MPKFSLSNTRRKKFSNFKTKLVLSDLFDAAWYRRTYAIVASTDLDAATHYLTVGAFEKLNPGPDFCTKSYYEANLDVVAAGMPALMHYIMYGKKEGREKFLPQNLKTVEDLYRGGDQWENGPPSEISQKFNKIQYIRNNKDVQSAGLDPWEHFRDYGWKEGRLGYEAEAVSLDTMLWRGMADEAIGGLQALLTSANGFERAVAGWVLARWYATKGDWRRCREAIRIFLDLRSAQNVVTHLGPFLLAVRAGVECEDVDFAKACLRLVDGINAADIELARLSVDLLVGADPDVLDTRINRLFSDDCSTLVRVSPGAGPLLDRLESSTETTPPVQPLADEPLVSIIVPSYNAETTLPVAIKSLLAQTWTRLEIIIIDDASTDASLKAARDLATEDARIRVIECDKNGGAYLARNKGLSVAHGDLITVHDSDDWAHPDKIARQVRALRENPDAFASISHGARVTADLAPAMWRIEEAWVYQNLSSLMFRRKVHESLGYWDRVRAAADTEFFERLLAVFGSTAVVEVCPGTPLSLIRTASTNLTLQGSTHAITLFSGPRRSYVESARYWHSGFSETAAYYLALEPSARAFFAPEALSPADPVKFVSDYQKIASSALFDPTWYRRAYADVRDADPDPVLHYLEDGAREGRDPGPSFSTTGCRFALGCEPDQNPLVCWEEAPSAAAALPSLRGKLSVDGPCVLVCAHAAGQEVFGAERSFLDLLERLQARGFCPVTVVPQLISGTYVDALLERSAFLEVVPQLWHHAARKPYAETVDAFRSAIRRHNVSEVHVNTVVLDAPLLAAAEEGRKSIVHVRELAHADSALLQILGYRNSKGFREYLLESATAFIANSPVVAEWLDCGDRCQVWLNRVEPELLQLPFCPGDDVRVAMISSNIAKKGVADFVKIAQRASEMGMRARFVIIGPETEELAALQPWPANVTHEGYAPSPLAAIQQADIVLCLSKVPESFGRVVLEAMTAGRPVITYDRGMPARLVEDQKSGRVIPADDWNAAVDALQHLCDDRALLQKTSLAARARGLKFSDLANSV